MSTIVYGTYPELTKAIAYPHARHLQEKKRTHTHTHDIAFNEVSSLKTLFLTDLDTSLLSKMVVGRGKEGVFGSLPKVVLNESPKLAHH